MTGAGSCLILIAGLHRLEAAKLLGWEEIECNISSLEGLQAELASTERGEMPSLSAVSRAKDFNVDAPRSLTLLPWARFIRR